VQKSISNLWKKGNRMNDLKMTEQTISSLEVTDMVEKQHKNLLRDITKYNEELNQLKIEPVEFFRTSTYRDGKGENLEVDLTDIRKFRSHYY
jgi:phage regulator Rha-like protein